MIQEQYAKSLGFNSVAISTVVRGIDEGNIVMPGRSQNDIWVALGFERTNIYFEYEWPTIMIDGTTKPCKNKMVFWTKKI